MVTVLRTCDVCKMPDLTTVRYGLNRQMRAASGMFTSWGRGGIDLCDKCWTRIGRPKMKTRRVG